MVSGSAMAEYMKAMGILRANTYALLGWPGYYGTWSDPNDKKRYGSGIYQNQYRWVFYGNRGGNGWGSPVRLTTGVKTTGYGYGDAYGDGEADRQKVEAELPVRSGKGFGYEDVGDGFSPRL